MKQTHAAQSLPWFTVCALFLVAALAACGTISKGTSPPVLPDDATALAARTQEPSIPTPSLTPSPSLLPEIIVESISSELIRIRDCSDPDSAVYMARIVIRNAGFVPTGGFHVLINDRFKKHVKFGLEPEETASLEVYEVEDEIVRVHVDYLDEVTEQDEDNNLLERRLEIAQSPGCTPTTAPTPTTEPQTIQPFAPNQPLRLTQLHMLNNTEGWAVGELFSGEGEAWVAHILRTHDGGRTWEDVTPPVQIRGDEICGRRATGTFLNNQTAWVTFSFCYAGGGTNGIWRTIDGGRTWELSSFALRNTDVIGGAPTCLLFKFTDDKTGWFLMDYFLGAGSHQAELFRTIDGGQTWTLLPEMLLTHGNGMTFLNSTYGWVTSNHPVVLYMGLHTTEDGGYTWQFTQLPYPHELLDRPEYSPFKCLVANPKLSSPGRGSVIVSCGHYELPGKDHFMYLTQDGGQQWQIVEIPGEHPAFINPDTGWVFSPSSEADRDTLDSESWDLLQTLDGGQTWTKLTQVNWHGRMDFVSNRVGWALSEISEDETALMHTTNGGRNWTRLTPHTAPTEAIHPVDNTIRLTLPSTLRPLSPGNLHRLTLLDKAALHNPSGVAFHNRSRMLFVLHADGTVTLWSSDNRGVYSPARTSLNKAWIYAMDFSPDGSFVATASKDGTVRLVELYAYRVLDNWHLTEIEHPGEVTSVSFSPAEDILAFGSESMNVEVWEFDSWNLDTELRTSLEGHTSWVWDVAFSPDGRTLASASSDRTIRLWDLENEAARQVLTGHTSLVRRVVFSPDGRTLASASWDSSVKLWDVTHGVELQSLLGHQGKVNDLAFSPNGRLLISASDDGSVIFWDPETGNIVYVMDVNLAGLTSIAISPDGLLLAATSVDGRLQIWGVKD